MNAKALSSLESLKLEEKPIYSLSALSKAHDVKAQLSIFENICSEAIDDQEIGPVILRLKELNWNIDDDRVCDHEIDIISPTATTRPVPINALTLACKHGRMDIVKILIDFEANVNKAPYRDYTPLHAACEFGHVFIVKYLLENGATIPDISTRGYVPFTTPFHLVCKRNPPNALAVAEILIQYFSRGTIDSLDQRNLYPMYYACLNGNLELCRLLIGKCFVSFTQYDRNKPTPIHAACYNGNMDIFNLLVLANCPLKIADDRRETCLHIAARHGHLEIVKILVSKPSKGKPNINLSNIYGETVLMVAEYANQAHVVEFLTQNTGAN